MIMISSKGLCCFHTGPSPSALGVRPENESLQKEMCVSRGGSPVTAPSSDMEGTAVSLSLDRGLRARGPASSPLQSVGGQGRLGRGQLAGGRGSGIPPHPLSQPRVL